VPTAYESPVVIRFSDALTAQVDSSHLLATIAGASISRANLLIIPGGKLGFAMQLFVTPFIPRLIRGERIRGYKASWISLHATFGVDLAG
jgi:phosphoribulokinase